MTVSAHQLVTIHFVAATLRRSEAQYRLRYANGLPMYQSLKSGTQRLLELGTTATLVVLQGRHLLVANVGDSAAVLGRLVTLASPLQCIPFWA